MSLEGKPKFLMEMGDFMPGPEKQQNKKISLEHLIILPNKKVFKK